MASENCSETMSSLFNLLSENKIKKAQHTFKAVLKALLEIRLRLPPIFQIDPRLILVDTHHHTVLIILSSQMFERSISNTNDASLDELRYMAPEELLVQKRELSTPMWTIGCMLYEAHFKRSAFKTHLNQKVVVSLIKQYPVVFPRSAMFKFEPDLNDCIY